MKQIIVAYGVVKRLCEECGTNRVTVGQALRLRTHTKKACEIRQRALQLGGVVMETEKVATAAPKGAATEQHNKEERGYVRTV